MSFCSKLLISKSSLEIKLKLLYVVVKFLKVSNSKVILQSYCFNSNPNDAIMELLITSYALKTSCANRVVGKLVLA